MTLLGRLYYAVIAVLSVNIPCFLLDLGGAPIRSWWTGHGGLLLDSLSFENIVGPCLFVLLLQIARLLHQSRMSASWIRGYSVEGGGALLCSFYISYPPAFFLAPQSRYAFPGSTAYLSVRFCAMSIHSVSVERHFFVKRWILFLCCFLS